MLLSRNVSRISLGAISLASLASLALAACMAPATSTTPTASAPMAGAPAAAPSSGRPAACPATGVGVFVDEEFQGPSAAFGPGRHDLEQLEAAGIENDSIRSICVAAGCTATLYADYRFDGQSFSFSQDSSVLPLEIAGSGSSLDVVCQ